MQLNQLRDNPGSSQARKRRGRGIGSGLGKTSGHGQKGQKSRTGVAIKAFEGGQMPLQMRFPKRGFKRGFAKNFDVILNLGRIQKLIDLNKIEATEVVSGAVLARVGLIPKETSIVRLLGKGEIKAGIKIEVSYASEGAVQAVQKAGGEVIIKEKKQPKTV